MNRRSGPPSCRSGATLVELLIFVAVTSVIASFALPMLFSATESRMLQQTVSIVEQNGTQALQRISLNIRQAQRVLDPPMGATGSVLALETESGALSPVIVGVSSGSLVMIIHTLRETITSPQVAVRDFLVQNTSVSEEDPSVSLSFTLSRTIRLQQPHSYAREFEALVSGYPDDEDGLSSCSCSMPACQGANTYAWQLCQAGNCFSATDHIDCP